MEDISLGAHLRNRNMYFYLGFVLMFVMRIAECEVVNSFGTCGSFFYKGSPPDIRWVYNVNITTSRICQRYQNRYHFATWYSSTFRIPLYSAYRLETSAQQTRNKREKTWFIEPQLSGMEYSNEMTIAGTDTNRYKIVQAINADYRNTNYDKGHLNPNFYQSGDSGTATFTLTNAVPQDPCFNQQMWKALEVRSKQTMERLCSFAGAKRYFVTGAVPSTIQIPNDKTDREMNTQREYNRVSVPSVLWTAACCDSSNALNKEDKYKGFSFGYYGENKPDSYIFPYPVGLLENILHGTYIGVANFKIFKDSCYSSSDNSEEALSSLTVLLHRKLGTSIYSMTDQFGSTNLLAKRNKYMFRINSGMQYNEDIADEDWTIDVTFGIRSERSSIWHTRDLLAPLKLTTVHESSRHSSLVKRELLKLPSETIDEYAVVPSEQPTLSATGSRCRQDHPCDYHSKSYKWCYTDRNNYWDYCCDGTCGFEKGTSYSWCYASGSRHWWSSKWAYCSQRSSMITVTGERCRLDHECGTHTTGYHWCYLDTGNFWQYCCQPWHDCSYHGESYKWCYVGYKNTTKWKECNY